MSEEENAAVEPQVGIDPEDVNLNADDIVADDAEIVTDDDVAGGEDEKIVTEYTPEPDDSKEPEGQTDDKPPKTVESIEDIKESRAYHQKEKQVETERRKAAETELAELKAKMNIAPPPREDDLESYKGLTKEEKEYLARINAQTPPPPATQPSPDAQKQVAEGEEEYEYEEISPVISKRFDALTQMMGVLVRSEQQRVQQEQQMARDKYQEAYRKEEKDVYGQVDSYQEKYKIPKEIRDAANDEAAYYVPLQMYAQSGGPTRRAQLVLDKLGQYVVRQAGARLVNERNASDIQKVEDAKKLTQPAATGPSAPGKVTAKSVNDEEADDIAEDTSPL